MHSGTVQHLYTPFSTYTQVQRMYRQANSDSNSIFFILVVIIIIMLHDERVRYCLRNGGARSSCARNSDYPFRETLHPWDPLPINTLKAHEIACKASKHQSICATEV